jgi:bifunctional non-homologous end joining protein LigD
LNARKPPVPKRDEEFRPELATLVSEAPTGDEWIHEIKFDGYRTGCLVEGAHCRLVTRNGNDWTARFPTISGAARRLRVRTALLDGEVTVLLPDGRTSFQALQNAFGTGTANDMVYFVFDLLELNGRNVSAEPLEERKKKLAALVARLHGKVIRYSEHTVGDGPRVLAEACRIGLEGIVSKRRNLPHHPGRSKTWLKTKCVKRQEFVIGGFTDPEGSREGLGALLVGVVDPSGQLVYSGKFGTGFTRKAAMDLRAKLNRIEQDACPFSVRPPGWLDRNAH